MESLKAALEAEVRAARQKLWAIEAKENIASGRLLVGKCYRYRNSYSCPSKPSDYWWLYTKVLGVEKSGNVTVVRIQRDSHGNFTIERSRLAPVMLTDGNYKPVTARQFETAWKRLMTGAALLKGGR